jgi:hypothetical protein
MEDKSACHVFEVKDGAETKHAATLMIAAQGHENLM